MSMRRAAGGAPAPGSVRALVTGGSGALGEAICRALAARGYSVIVHAHSQPERARSLAAELTATGMPAQACIFDAADGEAARGKLEALLDAGPIQVLVNNAGIHDDAVFAGMSPASWRRVIDVSLNSFYNVTQPLMLPMLRTRWGRIVTVSSASGIVGNRGQVNYSAAKAGLIGATKALAIECASRGVTVNAVAPGIIESAMSAPAFAPEAIRQLVPMQRAGTPQEVAAVIDFLCSAAASYVCGQVIAINGAMH